MTSSSCALPSHKHSLSHHKAPTNTLLTPPAIRLKRPILFALAGIIVYLGPQTNAGNVVSWHLPVSCEGSVLIFYKAGRMTTNASGETVLNNGAGDDDLSDGEIEDFDACPLQHPLTA
jgi:hypothetical protein